MLALLRQDGKHLEIAYVDDHIARDILEVHETLVGIGLINEQPELLCMSVEASLVYVLGELLDVGPTIMPWWFKEKASRLYSMVYEYAGRDNNRELLAKGLVTPMAMVERFLREVEQQDIDGETRKVVKLAQHSLSKVAEVVND